MNPANPKRYVIQKHVMASSVEEAIKKEPKTPIQSVFPDTTQPDEKNIADAIGFKVVPARFPHEY